jgi:hypothetical protein
MTRPGGPIYLVSPSAADAARTRTVSPPRSPGDALRGTVVLWVDLAYSLRPRHERT